MSTSGTVNQKLGSVQLRSFVDGRGNETRYGSVFNTDSSDEEQGFAQRNLSDDNDTWQEDTVGRETKPEVSSRECQPLARLPHLIARDQILTRLTISRNLSVPGAQGEKRYSLQGPPVPLENSERLKTITRTVFTKKGWDAVTDDLWPFFLFVLQVRDLISYAAYPDDRFGNTPEQLFLGTGAHEEFWSVHLGSYLPGWEPEGYKYWIAPSLLVLLPILNAFRHYHHQQSFLNTSIEEPLNYLAASAHPEFWRDSVRWLLPKDALSRALPLAEFHLLLNGRPAPDGSSERDLLKLVHHLIRASYQHYSVAQLQIIATLADVADSYHKRDRANFPGRGDIDLKLQTLALQALQELAKFKPSLDELKRLAHELIEEEGNEEGVNSLDVNRLRLVLRYLYTNYQLWSLNALQDRNGLKPLFYSVALYRHVYAQFRRYEIVIQKVAGIIIYLIKSDKCRQAGLTFAYLSMLGDYICAMCPNDPYVFYGDIYSSQSCLNGWLASPRPPAMLIAQVQRLAQHPEFRDIRNINLIHQPWANWTRTDWQSFLNSLEQASVHTLETFDLSSTTLTPAVLLADKIQVLARISSARSPYDFLRCAIKIWVLNK